MPAPRENERLTLDTVTWTPVAPPFDCNYIGITNEQGAEIKLRTDSGDASTEESILGFSAVNDIAASRDARSGQSFRYPKTVTAFWLRATSGTGPAVVRFQQ
jgi:hypothetical protein